MKGTIIVGGEKSQFHSPYDINISIDGQVWVLSDVYPTVLRFRPMSGIWNPKRGVAVAWLLKEWRKLNECTQKQAAETLGKSVSLIRKIEQGKRPMSHELLKTLRKKSKRSLWIDSGRRRGAAKIF